jgi:hypothetical protein
MGARAKAEVDPGAGERAESAELPLPVPEVHRLLAMLV